MRVAQAPERYSIMAQAFRATITSAPLSRRTRSMTAKFQSSNLLVQYENRAKVILRKIDHGFPMLFQIHAKIEKPPNPSFKIPGYLEQNEYLYLPIRRLIRNSATAKPNRMPKQQRNFNPYAAPLPLSPLCPAVESTRSAHPTRHTGQRIRRNDKNG